MPSEVENTVSVREWDDRLNRANSRLTPREREILCLIGNGKTTKEIATILRVSTGTVSNHRKAICRTLDTHSAAELVCLATVMQHATFSQEPQTEVLSKKS
jgi:DNA-binding CsgD family transcriptional regulator